MIDRLLDKTFTVTRTSTVTDPVTHIAKTVTQTLGPFKCRIGRSNGNVIQTSPQAVYTQSLRLYTVTDADIKAGDIITVNTTKYTVSNIYKASMHHKECDIVFKSEV
jgi:hypothetical protein